MSASENPHLNLSVLAQHAQRIDHVAIAVHDLEAAIDFYLGLGFSVEQRLETEGETTGMHSAVMVAGPIKFVLLHSEQENSQITKFITEYGPGPQHIALAVDNCEDVCRELDQAGVEFSTSTIHGNGLTQRFTARCPNTGVMLEFIERHEGQEKFSQESIQDLFKQLEAEDRY